MDTGEPEAPPIARREEPRWAWLRGNKDESRCKKSRIKGDEPRRPAPRTEVEDPLCDALVIDKGDPRRA